MIVLVGRISSATVFEPKYASIVQNKDELTIPLDLSTIPTAKEFKDAIESLSPEQQAFAKAFRSMQLESTLFGILVIQIKPQLEKVLNLAPNTLTKEIKLTQDLMQLFIKYQMSSDLLSFEADAVAEEEGAALEGEAPASERLAAVRKHVGAMMAVIEEAKKAELEEQRMQMEYELAKKRAAEEEEARRREMAMLESRMELQCLQMEVERECKSLSAPMRKKSAGVGGAGIFGNLFGGKSAQAQNFSATLGGGSFSQMQAMPAMAAAAPQMMPCSAPVPAAAASPPPPPAAPAAAAEAAPAAADPAPKDAPPTSDAPQTAPGRGSGAEETADIVDYTQVPKEMDARFERFDTDSALRPTIITPGEVWRKREQRALLAKPSELSMAEDEQKRAKDEAFDLLDALTKSGGLPVEHASLHVVVAATHCFDRTVTETVIQDNANPIEKVERSALIMASTVHRLPAAALLRDAALPRVAASAPALLLEDDVEAAA
eukprot:SRR837773.4180.p1 GENE.SRR837773.4180~~SRR837773.4180.p1  ORF type:complete len:572 (+),score=225.50 SRR837773.4180:249-1718(+)